VLGEDGLALICKFCDNSDSTDRGHFTGIFSSNSSLLVLTGL
jgi:hypothetical protein